jgi:phage gpG-like protein
MAKRARSGPTLIQQSRRISAEQKALYHQTLGAGKSRVLREFLGLTDQDGRDIADRLQKAIDRQISNQ